MKTNLKFGLVAVLAISLLALGMSTVNATENSTNPSDTFVHPGVGFEDIEKSNEYFVDAYGVLPEFKSEQEQQEFCDKIEKVHLSMTDELEDILNELSQNIEKDTPPTADVLRKTAIEKNIDISTCVMIKYGGINDSIVSVSAYKDKYIVVGWNAYRNRDPISIDELLVEENLTMSELAESTIDRDTMDEIYEIYYQRGKKMGIEDIPVVFELEGPVMPLSETSDKNIGSEVPVQENNATYKAPGAGVFFVISVVLLVFFVSRKISKE